MKTLIAYTISLALLGSSVWLLGLLTGLMWSVVIHAVCIVGGVVSGKLRGKW